MVRWSNAMRHPTLCIVSGRVKVLKGLVLTHCTYGPSANVIVMSRLVWVIAQAIFRLRNIRILA